MNQINDVVEWLRERAFMLYGPTMNAAHTKTKEWLWAEEITRLRDENENLRGLLREAHVKMDENKLWVNLRRRIANTLFDE